MRALSLILLALAGGVYLLFFSSVFSVKTITLTGEGPNCATAGELNRTANIIGENLLTLDPTKVERNIKDKYLCIRSAVLQISIPDKAKLNIKNRRAILTLVPSLIDESTESGKPKQIDPAVLIDEEGVVFATDSAQSKQPMVFILDEVAVGRRLEAKIVQRVVSSLEKFKYFGLNSEIVIIDGNYLSMDQKPKIMVTLNDQIERQLASLQLILDQAKIDTKEVDLIDARFDKPVVKYAPEK